MISMDEWDLKTAYTHLKTIRPKVKPKSNFLRQLIKFQSTYHTKDNHHEKDNDNDNENDDDEDDDIKQTKNDNKSNENTSNDKKSNGKKRKLEKEELQQPPSKKLKLSNGNENNDKTPQVQPRVFGVALPPHLIK